MFDDKDSEIASTGSRTPARYAVIARGRGGDHSITPSVTLTPTRSADRHCRLAPPHRAVRPVPFCEPHPHDNISHECCEIIQQRDNMSQRIPESFSMLDWGLPPSWVLPPRDPNEDDDEDEGREERHGDQER